MSTRSVIAYTHGDGWRGIYVHSDGYPSSRGPKVLRFLRANGFKGWKQLIDTHTAGLSWMVEPDEDPHNTSRDQKPMVSSGPQGTQYGNGSCYASWGRNESDVPGKYYEEQGRCSDKCDPLFIEWVWVADQSGALTVFAAMTCGLSETDYVLHDGGDYSYRHAVVWTGRWDGIDEPDWDKVEQDASDEEERLEKQRQSFRDSARD